MIVGDDDFIVLEGSNGRALAFAPGHLEHTAMPGERGNCVISAHRDTHFPRCATFARATSFARSAPTVVGSSTPSPTSASSTNTTFG